MLVGVDLVVGAQAEEQVLDTVGPALLGAVGEPVLAHYLKHWCLPIPGLTFVAGAIRESTFLAAKTDEGEAYGLERGADFTTALDLDDNFVPENRPKEKEKRFQEMLYRHLCLHAANDLRLHTPAPRPSGGLIRLKAPFIDRDKDTAREALVDLIGRFDKLIEDNPSWGRRFMHDIGSDLLELEWGVSSSQELVKAVFKSRGSAFSELVHASGGVFRDFLALFGRACSYGDDEVPQITTATVRSAARDEYLNNKQPNLDELRREFDDLTVEVIAQGSRYFMLDPESSSMGLVRALVQRRVVHVVRNGVPDPECPGVHRDLFAIDYGAIVDQIPLNPGLLLRPKRRFSNALGVVDPFGDGRRIPRVVIGERVEEPVAPG